MHNAHYGVKSKRTLIVVQNALMSEIRPDEAQRLQLARERRGFASAKDAATYFGWKYDTYVQHERGERGITRAADRYADAFRVSRGWLLTGEGKGPDGEVVTPPATGYRVEPNAIPEPGPVYLPLRGLLPRDVPEMGSTVGGFGKDDSAFEMNGEIVDFAPRPPGITHRKNVFCLRVSNDSMAPRYEDGDRIYVEKRKPAIRDYVVIELKPTSDGAPLKSFIKRLVAITPQLVTVEQFNPRGLLEFDPREINQILRVIPDPELRGE